MSTTLGGHTRGTDGAKAIEDQQEEEAASGEQLAIYTLEMLASTFNAP